MTSLRRVLPPFLRLVGLLDVALAFVSIATPAIHAQVGTSGAILLGLSLVAVAVLLFAVARHLDPRAAGAYRTLSASIGEVGGRRETSRTGG